MAYRQVSTKFSNDRLIRDLSWNAEHVFLLILVHPALKSFGCMRISDAGLAQEKAGKLAPEAFREAFREVIEKGLIEYDPDACFLAVPNFLQHNPPRSPNVVKSWDGLLDDLPECDLLNTHLARVKAFVEGMSKAFREALPKGIRDVVPDVVPYSPISDLRSPISEAPPPAPPAGGEPGEKPEAGETGAVVALPRRRADVDPEDPAARFCAGFHAASIGAATRAGVESLGVYRATPAEIVAVIAAVERLQRTEPEGVPEEWGADLWRYVATQTAAGEPEGTRARANLCGASRYLTAWLAGRNERAARLQQADELEVEEAEREAHLERYRGDWIEYLEGEWALAMERAPEKIAAWERGYRTRHGPADRAAMLELWCASVRRGGGALMDFWAWDAARGSLEVAEVGA